MRIGIDTGGTFTDFVALTRRGFRVHKVPSTPADPGQAVLRGLAVLRGAQPVDVVHGTTVGLNAILTKGGARTVLVTNAGFEDLLEIGRQARTDLYDLRALKPVPPVPRARRFGVNTRRAADGTRLARPTTTELRALLSRVRRARPAAIAIGLLHSYAHPEDEREIARALAPLGVPITCSAALLPVPGEYERLVAAVLNAAITPVISDYLQALEAAIRPGRLRLMRNSGGAMTTTEAVRYPTRAVLSGPAGGVVASRAFARAAALPALAALDMGGTSADVSLIDATIHSHTSRSIAGLPLAVPAADVHTIGCGGGSIAAVDAAGGLRVGPESAGADPGPACFGRGNTDQPTVTDAHMVLGHLGADTLLAGRFPVDPDLSARAVERLGRTLGLRLEAAARSILAVADVAMRRALLVITAEQAVDPATLPLLGFGGAAGLHIAGLAHSLGMPAAIVPAHPGAFSALGLALACDTEEVSEPVLAALEDLTSQRLTATAAKLERQATDQLLEHAPGSRPRVHTEARLRFRGQGQGLWVPFDRRVAHTFARAHQRHFGFVPEHASIEVVEVRARATRAAPRLPKPERTGEPTARDEVTRRSLGTGKPVLVYPRSSLPCGRRLRGPCMIEEVTSVVLVPANATCEVRAMGLWLRCDA